MSRTVRYRFRKPNRELPLRVGRAAGVQPPVGWRTGRPSRFDKVVTDLPIGSGPTAIGPVRFGRDITYVRDAGYWARDLACAKRGSNNFERITVKIYRDEHGAARGTESRRV
jgi:microcin C transport system substrate-binding protein